VRLRGESWNAHSEEPLELGEEVRVEAVDGLTLVVARAGNATRTTELGASSILGTHAAGSGIGLAFLCTRRLWLRVCASASRRKVPAWGRVASHAGLTLPRLANADAQFADDEASRGLGTGLSWCPNALWLAMLNAGATRSSPIAA
jgi:NfeD-like C-terminal, partner-binding